MHCCGVETQIKEMHRLLKAWVPHEVPTIEPNFQCVDMHIHSAKPANEQVLEVPPPECGGLTRAREHLEPQGMTNPIVTKITKAQVYDEAMRRCGKNDARAKQIREEMLKMAREGVIDATHVMPEGSIRTKQQRKRERACPTDVTKRKKTCKPVTPFDQAVEACGGYLKAKPREVVNKLIELNHPNMNLTQVRVKLCRGRKKLGQ